MVAINKISISDLVQLIKYDLEFAKENAKLSQELACFSEQLEYWNGKVDALEKVVHTLQMSQEFVELFQKRKSGFVSFLKEKFSFVVAAPKGADS